MLVLRTVLTSLFDHRTFGVARFSADIPCNTAHSNLFTIGSAVTVTGSALRHDGKHQSVLITVLPRGGSLRSLLRSVRAHGIGGLTRNRQFLLRRPTPRGHARIAMFNRLLILHASFLHRSIHQLPEIPDQISEPTSAECGTTGEPVALSGASARGFVVSGAAINAALLLRLVATRRSRSAERQSAIRFAERAESHVHFQVPSLVRRSLCVLRKRRDARQHKITSVALPVVASNFMARIRRWSLPIHDQQHLPTFASRKQRLRQIVRVSKLVCFRVLVPRSDRFNRSLVIDQFPGSFCRTSVPPIGRLDSRTLSHFNRPSTAHRGFACAAFLADRFQHVLLLQRLRTWLALSTFLSTRFRRLAFRQRVSLRLSRLRRIVSLVKRP